MEAARTTLLDAMKKQVRKYDAVIIGLGKTGLSCVRFLADQGKSIAVVDSRDEPPGLESLKQNYPDIPLYTGQFKQSLLELAGLLVISPGVSRIEPAIKNAVASGVELVGDIELFARHAKAPVIAITGSNGKSTVATLVNHMINESGLKAVLGGNIGTPALSLLEKDSPDFYVLELSSFQLETVISLDAIAALVLNISVDHMDRYEGIEDYTLAKQKVYSGTGAMIINDDDVRVAVMTVPNRRVIHYSLANPMEGAFGTRTINAMTWLCKGEELLLPITELKLKGSHNVSNVLAALALGSSIGLAMTTMINAVKKFSGLPHRCEWVASINAVNWINDSKGTNPGATRAAIEGLSQGNDIILIAGGDGKGADFSVLAEVVPDKVRAVVLIGRDANRIAASLEGLTRIYYATGMEAAVNTAARLAQPGNRVLLSPACASLDMFRDYQQRGEMFREAVRQLAGGGETSG